jgi:sugar phosphate permease
MSARERQQWIIVASLFVTLFLVFGSGYDTFPVFLLPLVKHFAWSHARAASLQAALALAAGLTVPLIGWMLDRVEARVVMALGAALAGLSMLFASRVNSFGPMLAAYIALGLGMTGATLLPCSLVIANWFGARRGLAMGIAFAGTSLGGAGMALVASHAIASGGWRAGYVALGVPMLAIVTPLIALTVRSRPPGAAAEAVSVAAAGAALPGLELSEALRTRSFWTIAAAQFLYACVAAGMLAHMGAYFAGLGYKAAAAAEVISAIYLCTSAGKLVMGAFADRLSGRRALALDFAMAGAGLALMFKAASAAFLIPFVILSGLTMGAPLVLIPLVAVDSLGLKRFGSIMGVAGLFSTIGGAIGPIAAGRIFDVTGSYSMALVMFIAMCAAGVGASLACRPLEIEQARLRKSSASAV